MTEYTVTIPIPDRSIWPNARVHWSTKAKAVKQARAFAQLMGQIATHRRPPRWSQAETDAVFYMPTRRAVDRDNAAASLKPIWDGLADAGIVENDRGFVHRSPELRCDKLYPRVVITIRDITEV